MAGETVGDAWVTLHSDDRGLTAEMQKQVTAAIKKVKAKIDVDVEADTAGVKESLETWSKRVRPTVKVGVDVDTIATTAKIKAWAARNRPTIEATIDIDQSSVSRTRSVINSVVGGLRRLTGAVTGTVSEGLDSIAGSLSTAGPAAAKAGAGLKGFAMAAVAAMVVVPLLASAIAILAANLVALVGQLVIATGVLIPLAGILVGLVSVVPAVMLGMQGLAEAFKAVGKAQDEQAKTGQISKETLEAQKKALKGLSPAAREFVTAVIKMQKPWREFRKDLQERLFTGIGDDIGNLSKNFLPALEHGLGAVATETNKVAQGFLEWAGSAEGAKQIDDLLTSLSKTIPGLSKGIGGFATGLMTLLTGSAPEAKSLADSIGDIGESFGKWAKDLVKSGKLTDFLADARETAGKLWRILGNIGNILGGLFGASDESGENFLTTLENITQEFEDWLKVPANFQALEDGFNDAYAALVTISRWLRVAAAAWWVYYAAASGQSWSAQGRAAREALREAMEDIGKDIPPFKLPDPEMPDKAKTAKKFDDWLQTGVYNPPGKGKGKGKQVIIPVDPQFVYQQQHNQPAPTGDYSLPTVPPVEVKVPVDPKPVIEKKTWWQRLKDAFTGNATGPGGVGGTIKTDIPVDPKPKVDAGTKKSWWQKVLDALGKPNAAGFGAGGQGATGALSIGGMLKLPTPEECAKIFNCLPASAQTSSTAAQGTIQTFADGIPDQFSDVPNGLKSYESEFKRATDGWFSEIPRQAKKAGDAAVREFNGLSKRMLAAAGSFSGSGWAGKVAAEARTAANAAVAQFKGLAGRISSSIGTVHIKVVFDPDTSKLAATGLMPEGSGFATFIARGTVRKGMAGFRTVNSPQYAIIGEAGPEAVVPLSTTQAMSPDVIALLRTVAQSRGYAQEEKVLEAGPRTLIQQTIMLPTGDPEAAAMAVANRLVFVGV